MIMLCPWVSVPSSWRPCWPAATTKAWFSMARARRRGSQWSRPVTAVEGRRHDDDLGAAVRQAAIELGEAQVVADRHAHLRPRTSVVTTSSPGAVAADSRYDTPPTSTNMWSLR